MAGGSGHVKLGFAFLFIHFIIQLIVYEISELVDGI
jgi:hypothetical protein